jgi:hypothetical protein
MTNNLLKLLLKKAKATPVKPVLTREVLNRTYAKLVKEAADCGSDIHCCRCGTKLWVLGVVPARKKITCDECRKARR